MIAPFWASIALLVPAVLTESTSTTSTAAATPSCTSSLITRLCSYPEPGPEFAVASESRSSCWAYCEAHSPCDFVIFSAGNPTTGTGTCWLYPGESFDKSQGTSDCANPSLYVYSKPECAGGSPTTTSGACAATETPSAIASVCGYPTPPGDCFDGCTASLGASDCLSQCARADSCSYVVFNPRNPSGSPYASGTCWMYPSGTFKDGSASECTGDPEQFVYNNSCPKPSSSSSSSASSSSLSSSTTDGSSRTGVVADAAVSTPTGENSASGLSLPGMDIFAIGVAVFIWRAI
ncbi:uncharacterized protein APUU_60136A [Aspergillus puulaauensis]|uniref:Apple domain-containing protein n=1 Tax=Aspergillus puulaauensis TaxID=1220207 RepID=A0A7R7XUF2_9EURO|nr:uncharacterized protein APUU_60136A [Aspergillus puulaauensis]BCS27088.1 hypothetical protein APUU_60136A [Aspergillus puulaauensis]